MFFNKSGLKRGTAGKFDNIVLKYDILIKNG